MQSIITFENKVALNENADIPAVNKIRDVDINEIKAIVNDSLQGTNAMGSIVVDDVNCKNLFAGSMYNGIINQSGAYITNNARITNTTSNGFYLPAGTYTLSIADLDACTIVIKNASGTVIQDLADSWKTLPYTFTTTQDGYICFSAKKNNDATLNPSDYTPQLEKGSTATNYTKGKHIIKEQDGCVKESTTFYADDFKCRNLFDSSSMIELNGQVRRYSDGVIVNVSGYYGIKVPVSANTTYIISSNLVDRNKISNLCYFNGTTYISGEAFGTGSLSFTTPNNCNYITFALSNEYTWCQLEVGSEATPYTPYKNFDNTAYVLWTNSSPSSVFAGQQITLNDSINNYKYYEIIYKYNTSTNRALNSGKIPTNNETILSAMLGYVYLRLISSVSNNKITFGNGLFVNPYGTTSDNNDYIIPYQIIAYK